MLYLYTLQLEKLEKKGYKLYMNQIKPMLLTTLKSYDRSQFVKDVTAGIIVAIIALPLSIALALHCCRNRCKRRAWRSCDLHDPCWYLLDPYGTLPLWKSDQIYSLYDHHGIHFRDRCYDRHRTVKRFLWCYLSKWFKTNWNNGKTKCICPWIFIFPCWCPDRWRSQSCHPDHHSIYLQSNFLWWNQRFQMHLPLRYLLPLNLCYPALLLMEWSTANIVLIQN